MSALIPEIGANRLTWLVVINNERAQSEREGGEDNQGERDRDRKRVGGYKRRRERDQRNERT